MLENIQMKKNRLLYIGIIIVMLIMDLLVFYKFENAKAIYNIENKNFKIIFTILIILINGIIFLLITYINRDKEIKPEKMLLCVVPLFSIMMTLTMPVSCGHDEPIHWMRAYEVSEGVLNTRLINGESLAYLPVSSIEVMKENSYSSFSKRMSMQLNEEDRVYCPIPTGAVYSPVQYLPHAIGITIARMLTTHTLLIAYVARMVNIVVCIAIMFWAIKIIPFGKNLMLLLCLLPSTIEGISAISSDGITISIVMLFVAFILHITFEAEGKLRKRDKVLLGILSIVIALCKIVYLPVIGLLLLIPTERYKNKKDRIFTILGVWTLGILASLGWLVVARPHLIAYTQELSVIKTNFILSQPIVYLQKLLYTISENCSRYIVSAFGGELEWGEVIKSYIVPYILFFTAIFVAVSEEKGKYRLSRFQKVILSLIVIVVIFLIFTSIFIQWQEQKELYITGVQGRYFVPILPLIFILVGQWNNRRQAEKYTEVQKTKWIGTIGMLSCLYIISSMIVYHLF